MLQDDLDVLVNRAEFIIFMQSRVPPGPGNFHAVALVYNTNQTSTGRVLLTSFDFVALSHKSAGRRSHANHKFNSKVQSLSALGNPLETFGFESERNICNQNFTGGNDLAHIFFATISDCERFISALSPA